MGTLLEYVGTLHIFLGPYRGNPIALYLQRDGEHCVISPKVYPWKEVVGEGDTPNKAAANFEEKWKAKGVPAEMYNGPSWEGGIKPEKPKPPPPPPQPSGDAKAASPTTQGVAQSSSSTAPGGNQAKPESSTSAMTPPVSAESGVHPALPATSKNTPPREQGSPTIQTSSSTTEKPST